MKRLSKLEHLALLSEKYTRVEYLDGSSEWHHGWNAFDNLTSNHSFTTDLAKRLNSEYEAMVKEEQSKHNSIKQHVFNAVDNNNLSILATTIFPELKGKLYARVLIKPIEDKTFEFRGETHERDMMYEYRHGEHVVPDVIHEQIAEVINQKGIDEIVIKRYHYNNEIAM